MRASHGVGEESAAQAQQAQQGPDCLDRVRASLPELKGTALAIARHLLAQPWDARGLTAEELARAAGVSANAVVRFSQQLGYPGYRAFANEFALALGQYGPRAFAIPDAALPTQGGVTGDVAVVRRIFELEIAGLQQTLHHLSDSVVERAVAALAAAGRVVFAALGSSAQTGQLAAFRLLNAGVHAVWSSDPYVTLTQAGLLAPGDVAFGIAHSGGSKVPVEALRLARQRGATTIALTAVPGSAITEVADVVIAMFGPDMTLSPGVQRFASPFTGLALVEALTSAVAVRMAARSREVLPGIRGAIHETLEPPLDGSPVAGTPRRSGAAHTERRRKRRQV